MRAGIAAVIIDVIIKMVKEILKGKSAISISIMVLSFVAAVVFNVNAALIIIISGILGAIYYNYILNKYKKETK